MIHRERNEEKKVRTIESWIQIYASSVLRFALLYTSTPDWADLVTVNSFAQAYRRMDLAHVYLTDKNALYGGVVTACRAFDVAPKHEAPPKTVDEKLTPSADEPRELQLSTETAGLLSAVHELSPDLRLVLLLRAVSELELSDISRILLLPKGVVTARLHTAVQQVCSSAGQSLGKLCTEAAVNRHLLSIVEGLTAGDALLSRIQKVVSATVQEVAAERRHKGPGWLKYTTVLMALLSVGAVDLGFHQTHHTSAPASATTSPTEQLNGLPVPLLGLPVTSDVQFKLSALPDVTSLNHMALTNTGIYFPTLKQSANAWPSIEVQYVPYVAKGQDFSTALAKLSAIDMVPPIEQKSTSPEDWKIVDWKFDVTGQWAVASIHWMSGASLSTVTQLYLLYLPSGESNLVLTIGNANGATGSQVMAVSAAGNGRVIVQRAIQSSQVPGAANVVNGTAHGTVHGSTSSATNNVAGLTTGAALAPKQPSNNLIGLPIDVYQLSGSSPLKALGKPTQIPALFGVMNNPTVFSSGLLFMGVSGQKTDASDANATWYEVSWNGDLTQFVGPPADGQQHFAVVGSSGQLWWAETTPHQGTTTTDRWQVLMSPLTADSAGQSAALNLNGPVEWFGGFNNHVAWVQDTENQMQLVVATVK